MKPARREEVRDAARYLREVRPLDPAELREYVTDRPHPAAVRQVLRELATDLRLVERADGTFVPAGEGPVEVAFDGVEALPEVHGRRLEDLLVERYGPGWPEGDSGDAIRDRIRTVKERYLRQRPVEYDYETALAYAVYHLPGYYAATQYVLADLAADGLLPADLRVLDVGAGVGGPALGLCDLLPEDALLEYHAVEPSAAADVLSAMLEDAGRNVHASIHRSTAEAFAPDGSYDLLVFANVLSELEEPVAVLERYLEFLDPAGSLVALAPADRNTATHLRSVERSLPERYTVYAPAVRLWPGETPEDRGWSFDVKPDLAVPAVQRRLDEAATGPDHSPGEFVNVDVQFAYTVLRADGRRRIEFTPDPDRVAKMAEMERHVTERVDLVAVKLSHDLSEEGNPLFRVGDGSQRVDHYAVLTRESALNRDLVAADYGALIRFENVLVLWNDDEEAYNLVVDGETVVEEIPV